MKHDSNMQIMAVLLVLIIVVLQLFAAWLLNWAANDTSQWALGVFVIGLVIGLSLLRFVLWGYAHRHYPLSHIYPLTALFFPCIVLMSHWQGNPVSGTELAGTALITGGVIIMSSNKISRVPHD